MLILPYTDRLWSDLDQLCQRILQTSCDRSRTSLSDIKIREFLSRQFTCGIYRSSCLICDHILYLLRNFFQKFYNDLLRFSGCCSIAQRDQRNIILFDQLLKCFFCSTDLCIICRCCRINNSCIKNLSCLIYNSQFTACTESRIPSKNYFTNDWRLHQKLLQILSKYMDCPVFGLFCQITSDLTLNRRCDQTFVTVFHYFAKNRFCNWIFFCNDLFLKPSHCFFFRCIDFNRKDFFFLTTIQGKHTMSRKLFDRLFKFIIHFINRRFFRFLRCRSNRTSVHSQFTKINTIICLIRNVLCNNIFGSIDRICYAFHTFVF